nr:acyl-CoA dehydrogenase family protein [Candidatus Freyarchaeota archaeon]
MKEGVWGITGFLVPADSPGLSITVYDDLGNRGNPRGTLTLKSVRVPREHVIGQLHRGLTSIMSYLNINKAFIGLMCLGAAQQSLDETIEHVRRREAYGLPIAMFEGFVPDSGGRNAHRNR